MVPSGGSGVAYLLRVSPSHFSHGRRARTRCLRPQRMTKLTQRGGRSCGPPQVRGGKAVQTRFSNCWPSGQCHAADDHNRTATRRVLGRDGRRPICHAGTARLADTKTGASLRPLSEAACALISAQPRIGDTRIRQPLRRIDRQPSEDVAGDRQARRSERQHHAPCPAPQLRRLRRRPRLQRTDDRLATGPQDAQHHITSRYLCSADAVLLAAAYAVAKAT
jgi:hypothetical protein